VEDHECQIGIFGGPRLGVIHLEDVAGDAVDPPRLAVIAFGRIGGFFRAVDIGDQPVMGEGEARRVRIDVGFSMRDPNRASPVMRWAAGLPTFDILQVSQQEEYAGTSKGPGYHSPWLPGTRNLAARRVSGLSREGKPSKASTDT